MNLSWFSEVNYKARIGGIYYRNVERPIVCNNASFIKFTRQRQTGMLGVNFRLKTQDGSQIADVVNNEVLNLNSKEYHLLEGINRRAVVENGNGRIWFDLKFGLMSEEYEIDLSCILFSEGGYPVFLHPNRSKFGNSNDGNPPNIAFLTLSTNPGSQGSAIQIPNGSFYLLGIAIENFRNGIVLALTPEE